MARASAILSADLEAFRLACGGAGGNSSAAAVRIPRRRLLLNSSHTHTGPVIWPGLAAMITLPEGEEQKLHN
jgi:hypothetical protein